MKVRSSLLLLSFSHHVKVDHDAVLILCLVLLFCSEQIVGAQLNDVVARSSRTMNCRLI